MSRVMERVLVVFGFSFVCAVIALLIGVLGGLPVTPHALLFGFGVYLGAALALPVDLGK